MLIEGQKNSIDAIRLKEFLSSTKEHVKVEKTLQHSVKDQIRLQSIMHDR